MLKELLLTCGILPGLWIQSEESSNKWEIFCVRARVIFGTTSSLPIALFPNLSFTGPSSRVARIYSTSYVDCKVRKTAYEDYKGSANQRKMAVSPSHSLGDSIHAVHTHS